MARKTSKEINQIKKDNNCSEIYSWSKYNIMKNEPYIYFLKYILHAPEDRQDSIYGSAGNAVHDLMENYYSGELEYGQLREIYEEKMFDFEIMGLKFDRNNKEKNEKIGLKYNECNTHFLDNFIPIEGKNIELESFLLSKVKYQLFQGYADMIHEEVRDNKNKIVITDFKTSTIYKGDKLEKEKGQLLLYAIAKQQEGWDVSDIIVRWLFTKYVHVTVPMAKGTRLRVIERNEIGSKLRASVISQLKKVLRYTPRESLDYLNKFLKAQDLSVLPEHISQQLIEIDFDKKGNIKKNFVKKVQKTLQTDKMYDEDQIEAIVTEMSIINSIENLPDSVREKFIIEDCFVEVDFNETDLEELSEEIFETIGKTMKLKYEYDRTQDDNLFYHEIERDGEYFHAVLSGYSPKLHRPYRELLEKRAAEYAENNRGLLEQVEQSDEDMPLDELLSSLGIDI